MSNFASLILDAAMINFLLIMQGSRLQRREMIRMYDTTEDVKEKEA